MSRLLAIDYGLKRCGIAVSDNLQIIAQGLTTVRTHELMAFLKDYFDKELVDRVLIGLPKSLKNEYTDATPHVQGFIKRFQQAYPDRIIQSLDERFTSKMAQQSMLDMGLKKKDRQNKALVDEISATLILQSYLAMKSNY